MQVGKLYQVKQYFWLLFPSKDIAAAASDAVKDGAIVCGRDALVFLDDAIDDASDWSIKFNCNVTYISENSIFCLLEEDENFLKVLSTKGEMGWMNHPQDQEWTKGCIEEVKE